MFYKFDKTFHNVFLEHKLLPLYYEKDGDTGDFKLAARLEMEGRYGECRQKHKTK